MYGFEFEIGGFEESRKKCRVTFLKLWKTARRAAWRKLLNAAVCHRMDHRKRVLTTTESAGFVKYWEIIADNLSKAGWSWGCVSAVDSKGRTIWIVTRIATTESVSLCRPMKS